MRWESRLRGLLTWLVVYLTASSLITLPFSEPPALIQIIQASHTFVGTLTVLVGAVYLFIHLKETIGGLQTKRSRAGTLLLFFMGSAVFTILISGLVPASGRRALNFALFITSFLALCVFVWMVFRILRHGGSVVTHGSLLAASTFFLAASGLGIIIGANKYDETPVTSPYKFHVLIGFIALALTYSHITRARQRAQSSKATPRDYPWQRPIRAAARPFLIALTLLFAWLVAIFWSPERPRLVDGSTLKASDVGIHGHIPDECDLCHTTVVHEWDASSHHHAANNPLFTELLRRTHADTGAEGVAFCLGCHAPQALDPAKHDLETVIASEGYAVGIGCLGCHRMSEEGGPGDGEFELVPLALDDFFFITDQRGEIDARWRTFTHATILSRRKTHGDQFRFGTHSSESCQPCHVQTLKVPTEGRVSKVLQDQFTSWHQSSFAERKMECADCHTKNPAKKYRHFNIIDHRFLGGSTYLARVTGNEDWEWRVIAWLEGHYMVPDGMDPEDKDSLLHLGMAVARASHRGGEILEVTTHNRGRIGHSFPNGPTDLFQVWMEIEVKNSEGETLMSEGAEAPTDATPRLGHQLLDDQGTPILDHRLHRVASVRDMGQIPAEGPYRVDIPLPPEAKGETLEVALRWRYRRMSPERILALTGDEMVLPAVVMGRWEGTLAAQPR